MEPVKLSELVGRISDAIENRFTGKRFWITSEITDVKKKESVRRCYLKFIEKENNYINTEIRGVFWANYYNEIENFEKITGQKFSDGLKITCNVRVRFHPRYGLNLDVIQIDLAYALGKLELEKQQTLERLVKENPAIIRLIDGQYITKNNHSKLPIVFQKIALITAPNSDGQRDFKQEIENNQHNYIFSVKEFLTQIQGDNASKLILQQLKLIEKSKENFDAVVIIRGGGSQIDFKPFDDYDLAKYVAAFPIPILTGIGHDRNTSIVDLMARQHKTPTKVATLIIDYNMSFESEIEDLKERFFQGVEELIKTDKNNLESIKRIVKSSSPTTILKKGFSIITINDKIITDPKSIKANTQLKTILKNKIIHSKVTQKTEYENQFDI